MAATVFPNTFLTIPGIFFFLMFLFLPLYDGKLVHHIFLLPCPSFYITGTHEAFWHNLNTVRSWVSRFGAGSVVMELKALLYLIRIPFFGAQRRVYETSLSSSIISPQFSFQHSKET